jgi:hypothetical protein
MKYVVSFLVAFAFCSGYLHARDRHNKRGLSRTEGGLVENIVGCLQNKDTAQYYNLFVPFDTLWSMVLHNPDHSPAAQSALNELKEHPQTLLEFDPHYNKAIIDRFNTVLQKGEDSGIHWNAVILQRYELRKQPITNTRLAAYDRLAPERFQGYLFVRDMVGRTNYCVNLTEIQKVDGYFYGGQVVNMLEASSVDEYLHKEIDEQRYMLFLVTHPPADTLAAADSMAHKHTVKVATTPAKKDPLAIDNSDDDNSSKVKREVVDRKYYEGKFDDEIPVKLYLRYMKEPGATKPTKYDGLYKFGDQQRYVKLEITRTPDGKWVMEDDVPLGILELTLENRIFTGVWTNADQNGFDVVMTQMGISQRKVEALDNVLDRGLSGRIDEASLEKQEKEATDSTAKGSSTAKEKDSTAGNKKKKKKSDKEDAADEDNASKEDPYTKAAAKEARRRRRAEMD